MASIPGTKYILALEGDVLLQLWHNNARTEFLVSSQVLCIASPVFQRMFSRSSRFKEALELNDHRRSEPLKLVLEEDDPDAIHAMHTILSILHHRPMTVSERISFKEAVQIALLCDKWDFLDAIYIWVLMWNVNAIILHNRDPTSTLTDRLFIAWVFHLGAIFTDTTIALAAIGYIDANSVFVLPQQEHSKATIPESVSGKFPPNYRLRRS